MARPVYPKALRFRAVELYREHGGAEASRRLHADGYPIPAGTVRGWASKTGAVTARREELQAHIAASSLNAEARKGALATQMLNIAEAAAAKELELIEESDLRSVVGARTRAIHDLQLLTGAATARTEHAGKEAAHAVADELAQRRSKGQAA